MRAGGPTNPIVSATGRRCARPLAGSRVPTRLTDGVDERQPGNAMIRHRPLAKRNGACAGDFDLVRLDFMRLRHAKSVLAFVSLQHDSRGTTVAEGLA